MATYHIQGLTWIDTDMEDGYVLVWGEEWPTFFMTKPTYLALSSYGDARQRLPAALWDLRVPSLIPRAVIEPEAASDIQLGLSLVDPAQGGNGGRLPGLLCADRMRAVPRLAVVLGPVATVLTGP